MSRRLSDATTELSSNDDSSVDERPKPRKKSESTAVKTKTAALKIMLHDPKWTDGSIPLGAVSDKLSKIAKEATERRDAAATAAADALQEALITESVIRNLSKFSELCSLSKTSTTTATWATCSGGSTPWTMATPRTSSPSLPLLFKEEKARVVQTLLFVAGINTLLQSFLGTGLPAVIGGSYTFVAPTISIILTARYNSIADPYERFVRTMGGTQGALIIASTLQIIMGSSGVQVLLLAGWLLHSLANCRRLRMTQRMPSTLRMPRRALMMRRRRRARSPQMRRWRTARMLLLPRGGTSFRV